MYSHTTNLVSFFDRHVQSSLHSTHKFWQTDFIPTALQVDSVIQEIHPKESSDLIPIDVNFSLF